MFYLLFSDQADNADNDEAMDNDSISPKSTSPVGGAEGGDDEEEDDLDGTDGSESKPINEDWDSGSGRQIITSHLRVHLL